MKFLSIFTILLVAISLAAAAAIEALNSAVKAPKIISSFSASQSAKSASHSGAGSIYVGSKPWIIRTFNKNRQTMCPNQTSSFIYFEIYFYTNFLTFYQLNWSRILFSCVT